MKRAKPVRTLVAKNGIKWQVYATSDSKLVREVTRVRPVDKDKKYV